MSDAMTAGNDWIEGERARVAAECPACGEDGRGGRDDLAAEVARLRAELATERARFDWVEANFYEITQWDGDDGPPSDLHWCVDDPGGEGGWMDPTLRGLADRAREMPP